MNKEHKTILLNQLRIMSAMQRLEYFVHQKEILEDLSEGIKDTQKILDDDIDNRISTQQENTNLKQALIDIREDIVFCINGMKNEYACTDKRTNRELHTMVKILEERLQIIDKVGGNE